MSRLSMLILVYICLIVQMHAASFVNPKIDYKTVTIEQIQSLIEAGVNPSVSVLNILLNAGFDVNARDKEGWTALMWAAGGNSNPEIIKTLIANGADPSLQSNGGLTAFDVMRIFKNQALLKSDVKEILEQGQYK